MISSSLPGRCRGFTYLWLLFFVIAMGIGLAQVAGVWHTTAQREKEAELLFIGDQFRSAIERYYKASPGAAQYPSSLEDLVTDKRFPTVRHHLRRIYADPMTGTSEWGLTRLEGTRIVGVHSTSQDKPLKTANFSAKDTAFADGKTYADWVFAFNAAQMDPATPTPPGAPIAPVPTSPLPTVATTPATVASATPRSPSEAERKARERRCQIQQRADKQNCSIAVQQSGPQLSDRCEASVERRFQACMDSPGGAFIPLDTSA